MTIIEIGNRKKIDLFLLCSALRPFFTSLFLIQFSHDASKCIKLFKLLTCKNDEAYNRATNLYFLCKTNLRKLFNGDEATFSLNGRVCT